MSQAAIKKATRTVHTVDNTRNHTGIVVRKPSKLVAQAVRHLDNCPCNQPAKFNKSGE